MATERVSFQGAHGDELAARVDLPVHGEPRAWALFAHCFICSKNLRAVVRFARELNREQAGVLRFDFTGLGESEGDFADTNFTSNVEDLVAAGRYMEREWGAPEILVGHSLGAPPFSTRPPSWSRCGRWPPSAPPRTRHTSSSTWANPGGRSRWRGRLPSPSEAAPSASGGSSWTIWREPGCRRW